MEAVFWALMGLLAVVIACLVGGGVAGIEYLITGTWSWWWAGIPAGLLLITVAALVVFVVGLTPSREETGR